mgnify:FL=1
MKMRNVRKCCRLHAKLAENQIGICLVCAGMMAMSSMAGAIMLLLVLGGFVLVGSMWFFAKTYRMLFGATGYGATGDFVRSLPLTEKEVFAGKLLTGSLTAFGLFLLLTLSQIGIARALSITIHWRTLAMNSPLILLMLVLLAICATALYSIGMAMTYQRGEENHTVSMVTWAEVIVLVLPFLVLLLPLLVPVYHASVGAALKPLLLITLVLAVLTPLLVRGAYRTFDWGTAEYRGSHRGGSKAAKTSILPQSKTPAQMYTWLLRQCGAGGVLQQCLWTLLLVVMFVVQDLPAYLIPILIVGTGARLQYEADNTMLYGENAPFYQLFPLSARQKVLLHMQCGCRRIAPLMLLAVNGYCVFLIFSHRMSPTRFDAAVLCFLLLNCALLTGAALCSGIVMFSVSFGNLWRDALTRSPSLLAGSVCEIVLLLLCVGVYVLLWRFAPLSKAVLLAILTALQLVGMFVFIKLNGWMLEKKYAV